MAWVFPVIAMITGAFTLLVVMYLAGQIIPPIYDVVINDPDVIAVGYDQGAQAAALIGLKFVLPLLALALVIWFMFLRLRRDAFLGQQERRIRRR